MQVSVTMLTAAYLVYMSEVRQCQVSLKKIRIVWTLLISFHSGGMPLFPAVDDQRFSSLDTIANSTN